MIEDFNNVPELPTIYGPAKQIAYIVDDIDEGIKAWADKGVGPFLVTRNVAPLSNAYYRGEKAQTARVNIAFAYVGDMQLELIELINDVPSLYKEALDRKNYGVHHYAVLVEDFGKAYDYALDQDGYEAVIDSGIDGLARMSYVENPGTGVILEVIEWNTMTKPYFNTIEDMVKQADPGQLVHEFKLQDIMPKGAVFLQLIKYFIKKLFRQIKQTRRPIAS